MHHLMRLQALYTRFPNCFTRGNVTEPSRHHTCSVRDDRLIPPHGVGIAHRSRATRAVPSFGPRAVRSTWVASLPLPRGFPHATSAPRHRLGDASTRFTHRR